MLMNKVFTKKITVFLMILTFVIPNVFGQMSRKPTATKNGNEGVTNKPDSSKRALNEIKSQADFDSMSRTYHKDTPYALPHGMFVIDRQNKNKIYYVNSQKFRFHKDFLLATYLVPRGGDVFTTVYINQDRRFIVGTVAWQKPVEKFTWELWEGDLASAELIKLANETINKTFFQKVFYKPNSIRQEDASATLGIDRVTQSDINKNQEYLALNTGEAVGRIHIIDKLDDTVEIGDNEIVVLKELPLNLPPVRGIIVAQPSTPLSHVNILAKGWGIPNVYIKDADKLFKEHNTYVFKLTANLTNYTLTRATVDDINKKFRSPDQQTAPVNLNVKTLNGLNQMRKKDSLAFGSKAANLGEMLYAKLPGFVVPDGFSVPFHWYDEFMKRNGLDKIIEELMDENDFVHNPRFRRQKLEEFRNSIQKGKFDDALKAQIIRKWKTQLGGKAVFVRSSSNAEDLPNFSGAGLYSSVPNVIEEEKLIEAVKKVWASLWKFEAYEARVRNYVDQTTVYMSALIQIGIDMDRGGVMITKDPFDAESKNAVYISAVCGHGQNVVNNNGIPEQILFNPKSNSVVLLTLSNQKNAFRFDENGDLKEVPDECASPTTKRILTDLQVRNLAKLAIKIRTVFGGKKEQDIEWGILKGQIYIVQARPYFEGK